MIKFGKIWFVLKIVLFNLRFFVYRLFFRKKIEMDLDKIFKSFSNRKKEDDDFYFIMNDNPIIWIKMFKKIILNSLNFNKKVENYFSDSPFKMKKDELAQASDFVIYHRGWFYISKLDLDNEADIDAIKLLADKDLKHTIELTIQFFEDIEDYERCAFLKKIENEVSLSLAENLAP